VIKGTIHRQHLQSAVKETRTILETDNIFQKNAELSFRLFKEKLGSQSPIDIGSSTEQVT
jgi:hypothetical protein